MHEGRTLGYFNDSAMCTLLGLEDDDQVMHSGTYSPKEPGAEPVDLSLLWDGSFNQCLLPFTPTHITTFLPLILHELNGQPYPKKALVKSPKEDIDQSLTEASDFGQQVGLSLPYIHEVLPKPLCKDSENSDPYQLCPYFSPSVLHICWTRINCRKIMLHAFINLCHCILHLNTEWKMRPPIGIQANSTAIDETVLSHTSFLDFPSLVLLLNCPSTKLNQPEMPCWTRCRGKLPSSWNSSMSSSCLKAATTPQHLKTYTRSTTCSYTVKTE